MNKYIINNIEIDSVDLKCMVISRGIKVDKNVYKMYSEHYRLNISPLTCNCIILSDGTIVQMTDMGFHLQYLTGILSWNNIKLLKYASQLETLFSLKIVDDKPALFYENELVDYVSFPPYTDFYKQKTSSGLPFIGNSVIQGLDWVAFQCLWACEYATEGKPCEFCFSGADFQNLSHKGKKIPDAAKAADIVEIIEYAKTNIGCCGIQITGGSTLDGKSEIENIKSYLQAISENIDKDCVCGEKLLYITPPSDVSVVDDYFALGASRIACSLELWDEERAKTVTPGKIELTTRKRHLEVLEYIAQKYGAGKAFSNFIIGIEEYDTLEAGATYLAERGVMPTASVWMPMGRPVLGSMQAPDIDYYKRVKDLYARLYTKYNLEPTCSRGLNVCVERDIWNYANP